LKPDFKVYAKAVVDNARIIADTLKAGGLDIVSGGTDNHMMLVDLRPKGVSGKDMATALDHADITVNMNMIPFDPAKPTITSGIRVGTAAVTSRGMKEPQMVQIAELMTRVAEHVGDEAVYAAVRKEVGAIAAKFPMPQIMIP